MKHNDHYAATFTCCRSCATREYERAEGATFEF